MARAEVSFTLVTAEGVRGERRGLPPTSLSASVAARLECVSSVPARDH